MPYKNKDDHNAACLRRYYKNKEKYADRMKKYYRNDILGRLVSSAKYRAKKAGIDFDITPSDLTIPESCPILPHIKIEIGEGRHSKFSPSIDRIDPSKGYVKGNVHIISYKANRMKSDGSLAELILMGEWAKNVSNANR